MISLSELQPISNVASDFATRHIEDEDRQTRARCIAQLAIVTFVLKAREAGFTFVKAPLDNSPVDAKLPSAQTTDSPLCYEG